MPEIRGKFIVLYGANNLGKSKQVEMLQSSLEESGIKTKRIKYPIYDLEPTGPIINSVLREGRKMSEEKLQLNYAQNRRDYEPQLVKMFSDNVWIIAEDYTGTGIAWGLVRNVVLNKLEKMNSDLLKEDLSILLYGERFKDSIEAHHRNENDDKIWQLAQDKHLLLAERYHWHKVYATRPADDVHKDILRIVKKTFQ